MVETIFDELAGAVWPSPSGAFDDSGHYFLPGRLVLASMGNRVLTDPRATRADKLRVANGCVDAVRRDLIGYYSYLGGSAALLIQALESLSLEDVELEAVRCTVVEAVRLGARSRRAQLESAIQGGGDVGVALEWISSHWSDVAESLLAGALFAGAAAFIRERKHILAKLRELFPRPEQLVPRVGVLLEQARNDQIYARFLATESSVLAFTNALLDATIQCFARYQRAGLLPEQAQGLLRGVYFGDSTHLDRLRSERVLLRIETKPDETGWVYVPSNVLDVVAT